MSVRELGTLARLRVESSDGVSVVRLEGEIDLSNADRLAEQLKQLVGPADLGLVLDLSLTEYIDSAGIRSLFEVKRHVKQRRQALRLVVPSTSPLRTVLEATGVPAAIPMHHERTAAVAGIRIQ